MHTGGTAVRLGGFERRASGAWGRARPARVLSIKWLRARRPRPRAPLTRRSDFRNPKLLLLIWLAAAPPAIAAVRYTVELADPARHQFAVTMDVVPPAGASPFDVRLPVWNALYQVRDFAQFVSRVEASNARIEKIEKSTWRVIPAGQRAVQIRYRYYANDPGPFGIELSSRHAFINPAQLLMYTDAHRREPVEVRLSGVPAGWRVASALSLDGDVLRARDYDHLADSPIEVSSFEETSFTTDGAGYRIVVHAPRGDYDMTSIRGDLERIVKHQTALMRDVPTQRFAFLLHFREGRSGGMEHADSTAIDFWPLRSGRDATAFAELAAHEFFHAWNVKRIRPSSLDPVDYSREQYTRALWMLEGVTSTIAAYTMLRTGMRSEQDFLERLGDEITQIESRPARLFQSLEESSIDAWMEKYAFYNGPERSVSYYSRGKLVGFLIDLAIRNATTGRVGIEDVMRHLNDNFAKRGRSFDEQQDLQAATEAVAGRPMAKLFDVLVRTPRPVPWQQFLLYAGLELQRQNRPVASTGFHASRGTGRALQVDSVEPGSGADRAGVRVDDEVVEINGRAATDGFWRLQRDLSPGSRIRLRLRRDGRELDARFSAGATTEVYYHVRPVPQVSQQQQRVREAWLKGISTPR